MRLRRYFRRFLLAGAVAGAAWAPAAGASTVDQIGGQLVPSSQLSSSRADVQSTQTLPLRLLPADDLAQLRSGNSKIGGYSSSAVPQSYLSTLPADIRAAFLKSQPVQSSAGGTAASTSAFDWRDTVIGILAFIGTCVVLTAAYVTRRRTSLRPA
jgi:hypothetical protein